MNHYEKSSLNFFNSNKLNRQSNFRSDEKRLNALLNSPESYFIPVWESKNLFLDNGKTEPIFLRKSQLSSEDISSSSLLGEFEGKFYFAINIENSPSLQKILQLGEFKDLRKMAPLLPQEDAALLSYSKAILHWQKNNKFCGKCGSISSIKDAGHKIVCSNPKCNSEYFPRTDPAIIVLVHKGDKCLLGRQAVWQKHQYATIAGFVEPGETLEQAVAREVKEETGIDLKEICYHSSQPWPFPGSIMIGYLASAASTKITLIDEELEDAQWFSRDEIEEKLYNGTLKLSPKVSISFKLIEDWFDGEDKDRLRRTLEKVNA